MNKSWFGAAFAVWSLSVEASYVIGLRSLKIAAGGAAADTEARRMVEEKIEAIWALYTKALMGGLGPTMHTASTRTLAHYRRKVRANRTRLTKG